ncbi:uncharacterized protein PFL1_06067 [Pseudozyma flocculosa PF-1]|uniref:Dynactin subunit 2 n=2 Tax=Pseudozyma flocculosa TaxID=84751 RepID=A0A5C3F5Q5_9BASI|nr:uncharacterized protein PFL1_06067 [Pseudozyma flocculosa PF-1]EPQ26419.1 hypothetical protein PFL1_06067 [Pseudozyma flocculosa PF-1]SPO38987.1 uncharacterized protein PSFLO_04466 [Pseudozyma flocculosa]
MASAFDRGAAAGASSSSAQASALPARHKYANLPDVDITAPDVYESTSVPRTRRRKVKPSGGSGRRRDEDIEGRKTAGRAEGPNSRNDDDTDDDEDGDEDGYSFESQSDESIESSDDDTPYKIRKVPRGWTKAAPRVEIQSDDIERTSLKQFEADKKFRNAVELDGRAADFSDRLKRAGGRRREPVGRATTGRGRDAGISTTTYRLGGPSAARRDGDEEDSSESLVDRLRRLKFEAGLLEEEIARSAETESASINDAGEGKKDTATSTAQPAPSSKVDHDVPLSELLLQLRILRAQLAQLDSADPTAADAATTRDRAAWEAQTRGLLEKLAGSAATATTSASAAGSTDAEAVNAAKAQAQVPGKAASTNIGALDRRLAELEEALGVNEAMLDENKATPKPILPTLNRLEQQLQLLSQPRHLDAISRRVKVLVTELDRVQDSRQKLLAGGGEATNNGVSLPANVAGGDGKGGDAAAAAAAAATTTEQKGLTADEVAKLQQLFSVSTRLDPLLPLIPTVLGRMQTLSDLHASSAHFAQTLDALEARQQQRDREDREASELMANLEASMAENRERMQGNLASLEQRIASLAGRMDRLSSP